MNFIKKEIVINGVRPLHSNYKHSDETPHSMTVK